MKWNKKGRVFVPDGRQAWATKHAFPPTPYFMPDGRLRLYVAFCDDNTVGRLGYVDVDPDNPSRVLGVAEKPLLDVGAPGAFDENGVVPTSIVQVGDALYLYYVGFQLGQKVRYFQFQGLAISRDGGNSFTRASRVPILDRSDKEMLNRTSGFVLCEDAVFKLWYVGGSEWTVVNGKPLPVYSIKYLESSDGMNWPREGQPAIDFKDADEHALGRPYVVNDSKQYRMWYSIRSRSKGYRLGFAESSDGKKWQRKDDEVGIDVSADGWDSQMVGYPAVAKYRDKTYLFYNGNSCGQTGFGYAELARTDSRSDAA
jgi:predicted GH43/DUF377 family glycosyl hydrolase